MELTILRAFSNPQPSLFADRVDVIASPTGRTVDLGNPDSALGLKDTENSEATDSGDAFSEIQAQGRDLNDRFDDVDGQSAAPSGATTSRSPPVPAPPIVEVVQRPIQALALQTKGESWTIVD